MYDEWRNEGEGTGLMVIKQTEYMSEGKHLKIYEEHPDVSVSLGLLLFSQPLARSHYLGLLPERVGSTTRSSAGDSTDTSSSLRTTPNHFHPG